MIKTVKSGSFLPAAWGADDFTEAANFVNNASGGDGISVTRNPAGGLSVMLGDDRYAFRHITVAEPVSMGDGNTAIAFKRVRVLCTEASAPFLVVPLASDSENETGGDTDCARPVFVNGSLTAILFGKSSAFKAYDEDDDDSGLTTVPVSEYTPPT